MSRDSGKDAELGRTNPSSHSGTSQPRHRVSEMHEMAVESCCIRDERVSYIHLTLLEAQDSLIKVCFAQRNVTKSKGSIDVEVRLKAKSVSGWVC